MVCSTKPRLDSTGPPKWIGMSPAAARLLDADLLEQVLEGQAVDQPVDHQAHRAVGGVGAEIDDAAGEARVRHLRHGDQQLPGERAFGGDRLGPGAMAQHLDRLRCDQQGRRLMSPRA